MFDEFDPNNARKDRRRFGVSLAVSTLVYGGIAGGVVAASAAARQAVQEEELVQIEFAMPPEPEPPPQAPAPTPPPPAPATPNPRPKVQPQELAPPDEIPEEKPQESDAELADAPAAGREGFTDGVAGGTGTAPAPEAPPPPPPPPPPKANGPVHLPENATPPTLKSGSMAPAYPEEARKAGVQGVVIAKLVIRDDGTVASVDILRGPEVFHAAVKTALMAARYEPARLPDGTAISTYKIISIPFKLENM